MKKIVLLLLFACMVLWLSSGCYDVVGRCANYPYFLETEFTFDANGGSHVVAYKSGHWWITDLYIDGKYSEVESYKASRLADGILPTLSCKEVDTLSYYDFCYSKNAKNMIQLKISWATIQWSAPKQLTLLVEPNATGISRKIHWLADFGNCWQYLTITSPLPNRQSSTSSLTFIGNFIT